MMPLNRPSPKTSFHVCWDKNP